MTMKENTEGWADQNDLVWLICIRTGTEFQRNGEMTDFVLT